MSQTHYSKNQIFVQTFYITSFSPNFFFFDNFSREIKDVNN